MAGLLIPFTIPKRERENRVCGLMRSAPSLARRASVCALLFALTGCGSGEDLAEVSGTVTLGGKPLTNAKVEFYPEVGPAAHGKVDSSGRFFLMTQSPGDGAIVGLHRVAIVPLTQLVPESMMAAMESKGAPQPAQHSVTTRSPIPKRYQNASTSGLRFEVKRSGNEFEIKL